MKTVKVIVIDNNRFALPDGMTAKDIQSLAGFLFSLTTLGTEYNYDASEYVYYDNGGVSIRVSECEVMTKAEARDLGDQSRARYQAKRDAEERAKAGDLIGLHVTQ
jgi:hypothetical protein